jgi:molybdopterin molybdotransferase
MISVLKAREEIMSRASVTETEEIELINSLNRTLAQEVRAPFNVPPFNNSAMDGFAVLANDLENASVYEPVILDIVDDVRAGYVSCKCVSSGKTIRIMTGAPVPEGADSVVPVEDTKLLDNGKISIAKKFIKGSHIRLSGEDILKGESILTKGDRISPVFMGLLASVGMAQVKVYKRPSVGILATGDEIVDIHEKPGKGQIYSSNTYTLLGQITETGARGINLGIVRDSKSDLKQRFEQGLEKSDILCTTGGVSVGDYDYVREVLTAIGYDEIFWRVAMKPGKPLSFGRIGDKFVFGLPGNPVSSMIVFEEFIRPFLLKIMGRNLIYRPEADVIMEEKLEKKPGRLHFVRVRLNRKDNGIYARVAGAQGSGTLKSMLYADALLLVPETKGNLDPGDPVKAHFINLPEDH